MTRKESGMTDESMAAHLGIEDRRKVDRRQKASPWLGTERRVRQRRQNPHVYRNKTGK